MYDILEDYISYLKSEIQHNRSALDNYKAEIEYKKQQDIESEAIERSKPRPDTIPGRMLPSQRKVYLKHLHEKMAQEARSTEAADTTGEVV